MDDKTVLISGLPDSGKTTYIAALWFYIFNNTEQNTYSFDSLANSELEYLNSISLSWAGCSTIIRTNNSTLEDVTIGLKNNIDDSQWVLNVPDIKGERFKNQFEFRQWDNDFESVLDKSKTLLLFIDPRDKKNTPRLIFRENQYYRMFGEQMPEKPEQPEVPWTEDLAPNQVKIVDFLQTLDYHRPGQITKIAVIVSCWDVVKGQSSPESWCKNNVPLLYQYLLANEVALTSKYFGMSAQGGTYEDQHSIDTLLEMEPLERIIVTDGVTIDKNILRPILWLTDDNQN